MLNHISSLIRLFSFTNDAAWFSYPYVLDPNNTGVSLQSNMLLKRVITFYQMIWI